MNPAVYFALGFALLISCLMISRALRRKRESPGLFESRELESRAREDLEHLIVQMQEVAREQIAKADLKIRMLNQLIVEADQKKKELEALLGRSAAPPAAAPAAPPRPVNPLHEKVYSLQDRGKSPDEICGETGLERGEVEMILGLRKLQNL
ncbi:MAG: hypothetical protein HYY17_10680 [Planctomycetes bacterium]|nr:hypothetical protein [Planctomycetota bacterium]